MDYYLLLFSPNQIAFAFYKSSVFETSFTSMMFIILLLFVILRTFNVNILPDQQSSWSICYISIPAVSVSGLDKFLKSIGRDPTYVDLEVI